MKTRYALIVGSIALFVLFVGAGALALRKASPAKPVVGGKLVMPSPLKKTGVIKGSGLLSRSTFLTDPRVGYVTDIAQGKFDRGRGSEIAIAGTAGAAFVGTDGSAKAFTAFSETFDRVNIIDVEGDGDCEFLDRGGWTSPAKLVDHKGKTEWWHGNSVDDTAFGDIDGDGKLEFAVGYNGGGGVTLLNAQGKELWNKPDGNVWHVEMTDTNSDGKPEIVHSNAGGVLTVRNALGDVVSQSHPAEYFAFFSLCRWPASTDPTYCLLAGERAIWLFGFDGSTVARFSVPASNRLGNAVGTPVKLKNGGPDYLAVLVSYAQWKRSILYLFDSKKALVYEEVFSARCESIAASTASNSFLVGCEGKVLRYSLPAAR